jgi:hypothetical protein
MFSLQQNQRILPGREWGGEVAQTMYIHVSKCKNNKIKLKFKEKFPLWH